jgi:hypothetical protein
MPLLEGSVVLSIPGPRPNSFARLDEAVGSTASGRAAGCCRRRSTVARARATQQRRFCGPACRLQPGLRALGLLLQGNKRKLRVTAQPNVTLIMQHVPWRCRRARVVLLGPLMPQVGFDLAYWPVMHTLSRFQGIIIFGTKAGKAEGGDGQGAGRPQLRSSSGGHVRCKPAPIMAAQRLLL